MYGKDAGAKYGRCSNVTGYITPYGVCDIFARLRNPYGNNLTREHEQAIGQIYDHAHGYQSHVPYNFATDG